MDKLQPKFIVQYSEGCGLVQIYKHLASWTNGTCKSVIRPTVKCFKLVAPNKLLLFRWSKILWLYQSGKKQQKNNYNFSILLFSCFHESAVFSGQVLQAEGTKQLLFLKLSYKSINKPWILCLDTWLWCLCKKLLAILLFKRLIFWTPEVIQIRTVLTRRAITAYIMVSQGQYEHY